MRSRPDSSSWIAAALVPPGRGDHVAENRRMVAGLLGEARAALEGLDHEIVRDVAGEPEMDGRVDQRLHHQEHVGRAGAGDGGRHRDPLLVLDLELRAERGEHRLRLRALIRRGGGRRVPDRHPGADAGGRVGHRSHDLVMAERREQRGGRRPGEHREHELARPEARPDLARNALEHLRLDREDDDIRARDRLDVRGDGADAVRRLERGPALGARVAGDDLLGRNELAGEQPDDHRLGHDAGADGRDGAVRQG